MRAIALLAPLVLLAGCASAGLKIVTRPVPEKLLLVAVAPVELRYDNAAFESERRTEDVLAELWESSAWPVLAPTEFMVLDLSAHDPIAGTDALVKARAMGVAGERVALLRTTISIREAQGRAVVHGATGTAVGGSYEATCAISVELHRAGGGLVASVDLDAPLDPFAEKPDWDDRPEIRAAVRRAANALIGACSECVEPAPAIQLATYPTASAIVRAYRSRFRERVRVPSPSDGAEYDAAIWRVMQYFHPLISPEWARRLEGLPPGFCVASPAPPPFQAGDCVVAVAGAATTTPHAIRRARAVSKDEEVVLTVVGKNGVPRTVSLR